MNNESIIIFCMFCQCYCWTLCPERGRKLTCFGRQIIGCCKSDCWTLYPERGRKHVGGVPIGKVAELLDSSPPPRGDGNRLAIGHKGAGRERVVGLFTPKRSRISTAAPSRNFYSTSDSCRTTVRRRPRGSCRGAPRIRGNDSRFHLSLLSAPMSIASECHMSIVDVIL